MPIHAQEWFRKEAERNITAEILRCGAGYEAKATRYLERDGRTVECTVYCSTDLGWHPPHHLRERWWELRTEAGDPSGRFVYLVPLNHYDSTIDYWIGLED